jgi:hypothetical protein
MITETAEIEELLDTASIVWPDLRGDRAALLRRVIERGGEVVRASESMRHETRLEAIRATAGILKGMYPPDAARLLKEEWPE